MNGAWRLGTHRFQRARFIISDVDRMSEITNPRTLEAMRTQDFPRGMF
jgi:hypothetical protein